MFLVVHFPVILFYTNIGQWWVLTWWLWLDTISTYNTGKPTKCRTLGQVRWQQSKKASKCSALHASYILCCSYSLIFCRQGTQKSISLNVSNQLVKLYTCRCSWWVQQGWKGLHFVPQCTICEMCCLLTLIFIYNFTDVKGTKRTNIKKQHRCINNLFLNLVKIYVT